ncbi:MAG: hypothetical protein WDM84_06510 [Bauldia sp.]
MTGRNAAAASSTRPATYTGSRCRSGGPTISRTRFGTIRQCGAYIAESTGSSAPKAST